jgi:tetratricopeptide (TPR) repeat protein
LDKNLGYVLATIAVIGFVFVFYMATIKPFLANKSLLSALRYQAQFTTEGAVGFGEEATLVDVYNAYDKTFAYNTFASLEAREQFASAGQSVFLSSGAELKKKVSERIDAEYALQFADTPNDARHYSIYGAYLSRVERHDEALTYIRRAEQLSPGKQAFRFDEGSVLVKKNDLQGAFVVFEYAYNMEPTNPQAQVYYALVAIYTKQNDIVESLLVKNPHIIIDSKIIQTYIATKQFSILIPKLEKYLATQESADSQVSLYLAASYLEIGNKVSNIINLI